MKVVCDGLELSDAVLKVIKATSNRTTNPVLEGIKLKAENDYLILQATDLELAIEKKIKADVRIEGETVVPGKFFTEYIKKLCNEQIELNLSDKNQLTIKYTDSNATIQCLSPNEFPELKALGVESYFDIKSVDLISLINKSMFSVAVNDSRPILRGCLFDIVGNKISSVALDGYRLALIRKNVIASSGDLKAVVPARSLSEISKLIEASENAVRVCVEPNYLMIDLGDTKIITRLLNGDFINYKQIIPTAFATTLTVNKLQLEDALDRVGLLSRIDRNNIVSFDITDKVMKLSSKSELGDINEQLTIALNGNDLSIDFNNRYFVEALRVIDDEFIKISFNSTVAPCVITSTDGDEYTYLILSVRKM